MFFLGELFLDVELKYDSPQLQKVLFRLLHNASKFGDVSTTITVKVTEDSRTEGRVTISNEGKPLAESVIEKIKKPFVLDENIMNHTKGVGMGLSISQALLKLHGSQLDFETTGKKVAVSFTLSR